MRGELGPDAAEESVPSRVEGASALSAEHRDRTPQDLARVDGTLGVHGGVALTGEHGVGLAKAPYMCMEHDEVAMDMMRALKKFFDPNNILNPGKMNLEVCDGSQVRL